MTHSPKSTRRSKRATRDLGTILLVATCVVIVALAIAWRMGAGPGAHEAAAGAAPALGAARSFGDLRLSVPPGWTTLARTEDRITWGAPDRTHVVTLSATEAASLPLIAVVQGVVGELEREGVRVIEHPALVEPAERLPRGDAYVIAHLRTDTEHGPVDVVQAWRRDSRAGADVVATWTSADGRWPVDPRAAVPATSARWKPHSV